MTPAGALAMAVRNCVSAATLLNAIPTLEQQPSSRDLAAVLASGAVCGWADADAVGIATAAGITVTARTGHQPAQRVTWAQVADVVRRGLTPQRQAELTAAYSSYIEVETLPAPGAPIPLVDQLTRTRRAQAAATLRTVRDTVIREGLDDTPCQQSLFAVPVGGGLGR